MIFCNFYISKFNDIQTFQSPSLNFLIVQFPNVQLHNSYIFEYLNLEKSKFSKCFSIFYFSNYQIFKTIDYSNSQLFKFSKLPFTNSQTFQSFNLRTRNFINVRIFKLSEYAHRKKKERKRNRQKMENLDTIPGNPVTLVRQVSRQRGARVCRIVAELPQPVHFPFPADWHRRFAIYGPRSAADYPTNRTANRPFLIRQSIIVKCSCLVYFPSFPLFFPIFERLSLCYRTSGIRIAVLIMVVITVDTSLLVADSGTTQKAWILTLCGLQTRLTYFVRYLIKMLTIAN